MMTQIAFWLIVVGAINWFLVGTMGLNLVQRIFGDGTITRIIYILVGVAGIWAALEHLGIVKAGGFFN